jgi:23S rRNA G2445 N2-methylase RlmL
VPEKAARSAGSSNATRGAPLQLFAVCAPGIEEVLAAELRSLGVEPSGIEVGGVTFSGGREAT